MSAIKYADGLRDRGINFTMFRSALKQRNIKASTGWDTTIDKLVDLLKDDRNGEHAETLHEIYQSITLYGTKLVKLYSVEDTRDILSAFKDGLIQKETIYDSSFPLPLERAQLLKAPLTLQCVTQYDDATSSDFIFCSKQFVYERQELSNDELSMEAQDEYGGFDEIYGITKHPIQIFDVVSVNKKDNLIEFRMDGAYKQKLSDIEKRLNALTSKINSFISDHLGTDSTLNESMNLYPCIASLYQESDGRILDIGHSTETAGIHRGKARGKKIDVREDSYHAEGVKGLSSIKAHMLQKGWDSTAKTGDIAIIIPGTLSLSSSLNPFIDVAYFLGCAIEDDYRLLLNKIISSAEK